MITYPLISCVRVTKSWHPSYHNILDIFLKLGTFSECFKVAEVMPIFESGNKHQVNSHRLMSLLPSFTKILEKLIIIRQLRFFKKQNIFYNIQHGFKKNIL